MYTYIPNILSGIILKYSHRQKSDLKSVTGGGYRDWVSVWAWICILWDSKSMIIPLARDLQYSPLKRGRNTQTCIHTDMTGSESTFLLYAYQEFTVLYKPSS